MIFQKKNEIIHSENLVCFFFLIFHHFSFCYKSNTFLAIIEFIEIEKISFCFDLDFFLANLIACQAKLRHY